MFTISEQPGKEIENCCLDILFILPQICKPEQSSNDSARGEKAVILVLDTTYMQKEAVQINAGSNLQEKHTDAR